VKIFKKHPGSNMNYPFDFTNQLSSGESLTAVVSVTASPAGDLTLGTPAISGNTVQVKIGGGGTGKIYVLTCTVTSTGPVETLVDQGALSVNDPAG
jgi:hypothetical protein